MYIFNTGNVSTNDDYGECTKEMRAHYYVLNREFTQINTNNSAIQKKETYINISIFDRKLYK